jgi:hypothetical protein
MLRARWAACTAGWGTTSFASSNCTYTVRTGTMLENCRVLTVRKRRFWLLVYFDANTLRLCHYCMCGSLRRVVISVVLFVLSMLKATSGFGVRQPAIIARFATTYRGGNRDLARPYERRGSAREGAPPSYRPKQSQYEYGDNGRSSWNRYSTGEKPEPVYGRFDGDHVFGVNSVHLALKSHRRTIKELIVQTGMDLSSKKDTQAVHEILQIARERNIAIREFPKHDLNMMTDNKPHQGFVLRAEPLDFLKLSHLDKVDQFR